jgi:hypothetical protein
MPKIAEVEGISIRMFYNDHPPPHFHAELGDHEVLIAIADLRVIAGAALRSMVRKVLAWARLHQAALALDWARCQDGLKPVWIE